VAAEVLVPTAGIRNLIREGKTHQIYSAIQTGANVGMQTMDASLASLVHAGKITVNVAESRSSSPAELRKLVQSAAARSSRRCRRWPRRHTASRRSTSPGFPRRACSPGESAEAVTEELKQRGLTVTAVAEKKSGLSMELALPQRVKAADLTVMTRQLSTMVSSGMTLLRAFHVLEEQIEHKKLKEVVERVREDIESGLLLSDALARHTKVFGPLYVAMVRAGEAGGVLEEALDRVADQLEKDDSLRRQVKSAMMYPAVVLSFAAVVLFALITFIVPVFAAVFKDFGGDLPLITKLTVAVSDAFKGYWYLIIGGLRRQHRRLQEVAQLGLRPPAMGHPPAQAADEGRRHRPEDRARPLVADLLGALRRRRADHAGHRGHGRTAGNAVIEKAMDDVIESVQSGGTISAPLKAAPIFPTMVASMIAVGEETGGLDAMLSKVADFYEDEVEAAVKALTSILEPIMIVFVGAVVGFVVVAMYMPMFKLYDTIQ
jgi:type IV pilus assembly protein PilC